MDLGDGLAGDVPTRSMRVKILYTFDSDDKINCLARLPDVLEIPAVAIDDKTLVGVIELGQCIHAIVTASPELVSRLADGDFTIYAYDYSEYDTPLVGQGMLSTALNLPEHQQNKTMITGRVCKNMLALFSNGVKETLEVKLRLVPVPRPIQQDLTKGLDGMRSISPAMSAGFDPNAWNMSMQHTKVQQQSNDHFNFNSLVAGGERDMALVDDLFGFASASSGSGSGQESGGGVGMAETPTGSSFASDPAFPIHAHSAPGSRAGSPSMGFDSNTRNDLLRHQSFSGNPSNFTLDLSRPGSRASVRSEAQSSQLHQAASPPLKPQQTEVFYNEDGQARKRAKVIQADWRGRSSFGSKSSDLRVTASTAASMHMHRPIPRKSAPPGSDLEPPPRVPTPVPQRTQTLPQQYTQPSNRSSLLRQISIANSDVMSDSNNMSDTAVSSPEEDAFSNNSTTEGTPMEMPSSPPVFQDGNLPQPSSPGLPTLPPSRVTDSGYMSERGLTSSNVIPSMENEKDQFNTETNAATVGQYYQREESSQPFIKIEGSDATRTRGYQKNTRLAGDMNISLERPGDMNQLPEKLLLNIPPRSGRGGSVSTPAPTALSEPPHSRRSSLALPPKTAAPALEGADAPGRAPSRQSGLKSKQSTQLSRTSSNESDAGSPAPSDTEGRPRGPNRSGSGAQRRKIIEKRLQESIANGKMPQFCSHCGAIETPTWRRLYVKHVDGKPSPLDYQEGEGETVGIETVSTDESGEISSFAIRKAMKKTKDAQPEHGFVETVVCNPCGLWFNKYKFMRPSDKWGGRVGSRRSKKRKDGEVDVPTDCLEPQSDAFFTDQIAPDETPEDVEAGRAERSQLHIQSQPISALVNRPRANSMQPNQSRRLSAQESQSAEQSHGEAGRAVQSSPVRFPGSQESPIEIEDRTPKPTRRLLFPSPRREGETKSLGSDRQDVPPTNDDVFLENRTPSPKTGVEFSAADGNIFETFTSFDKENMPPPVNFEYDESFDNIFGGSPSGLFKTPRKSPSKSVSTPKSTLRSNQLLKTPTPASRKRKVLSPKSGAINKTSITTNDFMTSPSSSRYFLRSTPSRLDRTPGRTPRRSGSGSNSGISPWSRHLAQILSESNPVESFTSPIKDFDLSDLPTFTTPGRTLTDCDWQNLEDIVSSEFAMLTEPEHGSSSTD